VASEKGLSNVKREIANIEDLAEFARVLLATTQMTFEGGEERVNFGVFVEEGIAAKRRVESSEVI
jgi:hypothetical protein